MVPPSEQVRLFPRVPCGSFGRVSRTRGIGRATTIWVDLRTIRTYQFAFMRCTLQSSKNPKSTVHTKQSSTYSGFEGRAFWSWEGWWRRVSWPTHPRIWSQIRDRSEAGWTLLSDSRRPNRGRPAKIVDALFSKSSEIIKIQLPNKNMSDEYNF